MQKQFTNIMDFMKVREKCFFCETPLSACLTNFIGIKKSGLPVLNTPIEDDVFSFQIHHTTESYDIRANGAINTKDNDITIHSLLDSETPVLDNQVAMEAFYDLKPTIELHCTSKRCKNNYYLSSYILEPLYPPCPFSYNTSDISTHIKPLKLFIEQFQMGDLIVHNDWIREQTCIFSNTNEGADPIRMPLIDFDELGPDKLLQRIRMITLFT